MNEGWKYIEKICYIAHIWAKKEKEKEVLEDFDYEDMANAVEQFINCLPDNVNFITHIENCFDVLEAECEGREAPRWTIEYFKSRY
jgi:hypothetical protein